MSHRHDPRHRKGKSATSRKPARPCSCVGCMLRLDRRAAPATHTWAPVSATAAVRCLAPLPSATVTSMVGWRDTFAPAVVTDPETALADAMPCGRLELLQHLLKWPFLRQATQTASLAGQEALSGACEVPQFQQVREGCVLPEVVAAAASSVWSPSSSARTVPAARLLSR